MGYNSGITTMGGRAGGGARGGGKGRETTASLNKRLSVKKIDPMAAFPTEVSTIRFSMGTESHPSYGLYVEGKGFAQWKDDNKMVAYPRKSTAQSIVSAGGFTSYDNIKFINPVGRIGDRHNTPK